MRVQQYHFRVVSATGGAWTGYTQAPVNGRLLQIYYKKTDFADGHTMTFTGEDTGIPLFAVTGINASAILLPRGATHTLAGAAALYAAGGVAVLGDGPWVVEERIKLVIAGAGDAKIADYYVAVG